MIQIYHNARCSKSRECLVFLEGSDTEFEVINYLETPPTAKELTEIIAKLGIRPIDLVRRSEKIWIEQFKDKKLTDKQLIKAMVANPILIERPIVINGEKAVIARPFGKASEII